MTTADDIRSTAARATLLAAAALVLAGGARTAHAQAAPPPPPSATATAAPSGNDGAHGAWLGSLGWRMAFIGDRGLDPFDKDDALVQVSAAGKRLLAPIGHLVPAVGVVWEYGGSSAAARGADASLHLMRAGLVLEARYVTWKGIHVFAHATPALLHAAASLSDPATPAALQASYTTFALDAGGGLAVPLAHVLTNAWTLWLVAEGGYGWAPRHDLALAPALPDGEHDKAGTTALGALAPRGPFMRFSLALSR